MSGNCLFTSCGHHLKVDARTLRCQVAQFIQGSLQFEISGVTLRTWIEDAGENPRHYAKKMALNGVMGTGVEVAIISILYQRTIYVLFKDKGITTEYFPEFGSPFQIVFMGPALGGHYEPN